MSPAAKEPSASRGNSNPNSPKVSGNKLPLAIDANFRKKRKRTGSSETAGSSIPPARYVRRVAWPHKGDEKEDQDLHDSADAVDSDDSDGGDSGASSQIEDDDSDITVR